MDRSHLNELFDQAIETELCGERLYEAAFDSAVNEDLKKEWGKYLDETRNHQKILSRVFDAAGLDIDGESPSREVVRHKGEALVAAVRAARDSDDARIGELVAAESVV